MKARAEEIASIAQDIRLKADRVGELTETLEPYLRESGQLARRELQVVARRLGNLAKVAGTNRVGP